MSEPNPNTPQPRRKYGLYLKRDYYDVVVALSEGACPWLSATDIRLLEFLVRAKNGRWETLGGQYSLDWVAARLNVSVSAVKKSLARLRKNTIIETRRSPLRTAFWITPRFARGCTEYIERRHEAPRFSRSLDLLSQTACQPVYLDSLIALTVICNVEPEDYELLGALQTNAKLRHQHLRCPDDPEGQQRLTEKAEMHLRYAGLM